MTTAAFSEGACVSDNRHDEPQETIDPSSWTEATERHTMTGLLRQIQSSAADGSVSLATLLRQCQILATRLGNDSLRAWVSRELNGYPVGTELPDYRQGTRGQLVGTVANIARQYRNAPLAESSIPAEFREGLLQESFPQSVAELESLAQAEGNLVRRVPPELWGFIEESLNGYSVLDAHVTFSRATAAGVLDKIRTKTLELALELEALNPNMGDEQPESFSESDVQRVINNTIFAGNVNVAQASTGVTQSISVGIQAKDLESLTRFLRDVGVSQGELEELRDDLAADAASGHDRAPGPRTQGWIGRVTYRLALAAGDVSTSAAGQLIATALAAYFRIGA